MSINKYLLITPELKDELNRRYSEFCKVLDKPDVPPVRVFNPLKQKNLDDIKLIRELSKQLQKKKEDDVKKAAEAAAEAKAAAIAEAEAKAAEEAAKAAEQTAEETSEVKEV